MCIQALMGKDNRKPKFRICCPVCGKELMRSSRANDEIKCSHCKKQLVVYLEDDILRIFLDNRKKISV